MLTILLTLQNLAKVVALDGTSDPSEVLDTVRGGSGQRNVKLEKFLIT